MCFIVDGMGYGAPGDFGDDTAIVHSSIKLAIKKDLHTSYSTDAGMVGARRVPDDAYRFAKGETVTSNLVLTAKLKRPEDVPASIQERAYTSPIWYTPGD